MLGKMQAIDLSLIPADARWVSQNYSGLWNAYRFPPRLCPTRCRWIPDIPQDTPTPIGISRHCNPFFFKTLFTVDEIRSILTKELHHD